MGESAAVETNGAAGAAQPRSSTGDESTADGHVQLVLPALPQFAPIARVALASLALRQGFDYSEVEDLRLAVDEGMVLLLGVADRRGQIRLDVSLAPERVEVVLTGEFEGAVEAWAVERFYRLAGELVDHHEIDPDELTVEFVISHS
ncbi:MAG: hypothetical protein GY929_07215 [Actinomycetia bacterium]|nr:hypothetical protein [Actinomycetes bacterium]